MQDLSTSLEDYLEAIYNLRTQSQIARVKDIASTLQVKMPSVTSAIRVLASKGLVTHKPYESVELTETGMEAAKSVADRHHAIKDFLVNSLRLEEDDAQSEACRLEHAIRSNTLDRLLYFAEFVKDSGIAQPPLEDFPQPTCQVPTTPQVLHLSDMCPGSKCKIARVRGHGPIRKRFMEMGLTSGADVEVVRIAPLGDPVEIKIRGYLLSLRMNEAEQIDIEAESNG